MDSKKLIDNLSKATDIEKEQITSMIEAFGEIIVSTTSKGDSVALPSFGSFEVSKRDERIITHPASGKKMLIPPKLTLNFRPSAVLKQRIRRSETD